MVLPAKSNMFISCNNSQKQPMAEAWGRIGVCRSPEYSPVLSIRTWGFPALIVAQCASGIIW